MARRKIRKVKRIDKIRALMRSGKRKVTNQNAGTGQGLLGNTAKALVIHRGLGFPARFRTKLRYTETIAITSTAGALNYQVYICNGLFDPNATGTGHQPMFFDQFMAIYNHYKVLGSKIQARCIPNSGSAASSVDAFRSAIIVNDNSTIAGGVGMEAVIEWGNLNKYLVLGGSNAPLGQKVLNARWSCKKYFKDKYLSADLTGTIAANPVEQSTFIIAQQPYASSTITNFYEVIIDYIVDFFERTDIGQS